MSDELVIYLLVRADLRMGKGKIAAQCGHAVEYLLRRCGRPVWNAYSLSGSAKIVLSVPDLTELKSIEQACKENKVLTELVIDAGRTQVASDTPTVLGIGPVRRKNVREIVSHLKLI